MRFSNLVAAAAAFTTTTVSATAQTVDRAAPATPEANALFGGSALLTIALIVALGIGIFLLVDDEDDPDSP